LEVEIQTFTIVGGPKVDLITLHNIPTIDRKNMWKGLSWQTLTIVPLWPKSRVLSISKGREIHRPHQQLNPLLSLSTKSKMKLSSSLYRLVEKNKQRPNYLFIFAYRHYGNLKYVWSVSSMVPKSKLVLFVAFSILLLRLIYR
jgi:hypothetical protein